MMSHSTEWLGLSPGEMRGILDVVSGYLRDLLPRHASLFPGKCGSVDAGERNDALRFESERMEAIIDLEERLGREIVSGSDYDTRSMLVRMAGAALEAERGERENLGAALTEFYLSVSRIFESLLGELIRPWKSCPSQRVEEEREKLLADGVIRKGGAMATCRPGIMAQAMTGQGGSLQGRALAFFATLKGDPRLERFKQMVKSHQDDRGQNQKMKECGFAAFIDRTADLRGHGTAAVQNFSPREFAGYYQEVIFHYRALWRAFR